MGRRDFAQYEIFFASYITFFPWGSSCFISLCNSFQVQAMLIEFESGVNLGISGFLVLFFFPLTFSSSDFNSETIQNIRFQIFVPSSAIIGVLHISFTQI